MGRATRALKADANPLLLRVNMDAGHGGASGRFDRLEESRWYRPSPRRRWGERSSLPAVEAQPPACARQTTNRGECVETMWRGTALLLEERRIVLKTSLQTAKRGDHLGHRIARPGALIRAAVAVALVVAGCGSSNSTATNPNAVSATPASLRALGISLKQPIYWVGPAPKMRYEHERGRWSHPRALPAERCRSRHGRPPPHDRHLQGGERVLGGTESREQARDGADQCPDERDRLLHDVAPSQCLGHLSGIELSDRSLRSTPGRARRLVSSGKVVRVPGTRRRTAGRRLAEESLAKVATATQRPIYWAGPQPNQVYELTQTKQGATLLRYLPPGHRSASRRPVDGRHLSGAERRGCPSIKRLALAKGATLIPLAGAGSRWSIRASRRASISPIPGSNF